MKKFDIAFSMGFSCGGTMALRKAKMQFTSYPLDWIGSPGIVQSARMIASDFAGWLEKDDLQMVAVRGGSFQNNVYQNRRTRFGFPHDFSRMFRFGEIYPMVAEKYSRRVRRFSENLGKARSALVVYIERPIDPRVPDADLVEAKRILGAKFPAVSFELVYFFIGQTVTGFDENIVADGITAVACDYKQLDHGEISHAIVPDVPARYLSSRFAVDDVRSEAEKSRYANEHAEVRARKFSGDGGFIVRRINEMKYRLYRRLERDLQEKGIVPRDFPLWFD